MRVRHSKYSLLLLYLYNSLVHCDAELAKQHSSHYSSLGWQHCPPSVTSKGQKRSLASQDPKPQAHQASRSFIFCDLHLFFSTFKWPQKQSEWCHRHSKLVAILIKSGEMRPSLEIPSHLCSFPSMVDSAVLQRHPHEACIYIEAHHRDVLL